MTTNGGDRCKLSLPLLSLCQVGYTVSFVLERCLGSKRVVIVLGLHINPPVWSWWVLEHHWPGSQPSMPLCSAHWLVHRYTGVHRVWCLDYSHCLENMLQQPLILEKWTTHLSQSIRRPAGWRRVTLADHVCEKPMLTVYVLEMFEVACYTALYSNLLTEIWANSIVHYMLLWLWGDLRALKASMNFFEKAFVESI